MSAWILLSLALAALCTSVGSYLDLWLAGPGGLKTCVMPTVTPARRRRRCVVLPKATARLLNREGER